MYAPKPTALRLIQNNPGKRAINKKEPKPKFKIPDPPEGMSDGARMEWPYFAKLVSDMRVLTVADGPALASLCEAWSEMKNARMRMELLGGPTYEVNGIGGTRYYSRPEQKVIQDADRRCRALLNDFGLTPAARTRIQVTDGEGDDEEATKNYFG